MRHDATKIRANPALTPTCALVPGYKYKYTIKLELLKKDLEKIDEDEEDEVVAVHVCHSSHSDPLALIVLSVPQPLGTFS